MIGVLILTHGQFGEDLLRTACLIMKDEKKVTALNISRRLEFKDLRKKVTDKVMELDARRGVLVLVDAYGGTSYNTCVPLMKEFKLNLVTGVNLPMVLSALTNRGRMSLTELAKKVSDDAKKTISVMGPSF